MPTKTIRNEVYSAKLEKMLVNMIGSKLKDNANGYGNQFKELLKPINKKWQDVNFNSELSEFGINFEF